MNQLTGFSKVNFTCDKCGREFQQEVAYSMAKSWEELDENNTYCVGCVEKEEKKTEKENKRKQSISRKKDFGLPPQEASENLRSLEIDKRTLRKTNRIHQFNTSVSKE